MDLLQIKVSLKSKKEDKILHQDEVISKELFPKTVNVEKLNMIMIVVNFLHKLFEH